MVGEYQVYFAGPLFDHKEVIGNALLASFIEKKSERRYVCVLPQNLEQSSGRAVNIRNEDLKQLMSCDLALFNFDGTELDSGTVVEFIFAKMLDIPAVVVRSDFRSSGDQDKDGDDWNLMCSFYPRTKVVRCNAMACYHAARNTSESLDRTIEVMYSRIAEELIKGLNEVRSESPLLDGDRDRSEWIYQWALAFPGSGLAEHCSDPHFAQKVVSRKLNKRLL